MRHDVTVEGPAFRLRPVERADAALIVELRRDPVRTGFLHPIPLDVAEQERYLDRYFEREHDYYFVVERREDGRAEGLIGIYDLDPARSHAVWRRWILREDSLAAVESALLIYRVGFEVLGLRTMGPQTVAENHRVVSFHDSCGLPRFAHLPGHFHIQGRPVDAIEHRLSSEQWPEVRERLEASALRTQRRLTRRPAQERVA